MSCLCSWKVTFKDLKFTSKKKKWEQDKLLKHYV